MPNTDSPQQFTHDVFLSHNAKDKPRVRQLAEQLRDAGLIVWFDEWNILPGEDIFLAVEKGLEQSRVLLLCLSPAALGSDWVKLERGTVLFRDPANTGRRFIPLLLEDCDPPDTLKRYKYLDFKPGNQQKEAEAFAALLATLGKGGNDGAAVGNEPATGAGAREEDSGRVAMAEGNRTAGAIGVRAQPPAQPTETGGPWSQTEEGSENAIPGDSASAGPRPREIPRPPAAARPAPARSDAPVPATGSEEAAARQQVSVERERILTGHERPVWSVAVGPDGQWAVSGSMDTTVRIWGLKTGDCRAVLKGHRKAVTAVAITADGGEILSGSGDGSIRRWEAASGEPIADWPAHQGAVFSLAVLADGGRLLSGGRDSTVKLWDLASRECLMELAGHTQTVASVAVSADGRQALSASWDKTLRLWELKTGACLAVLTGHSGAVLSVQITVDGRFAVSGAEDKTVRLWDLSARRCLGVLEGHQGPITSVALSPDGYFIASTGFTDKTVRLWDRASGRCLHVIEYEDKASPVSVAFGPDGKRLLVGTANSTIYLYRLGAGLMSGAAAPPEPSRRYVNAKVVLLGEGAVGKTSLAHRLIADEYVIRDRTHGMNVWRLGLAAGGQEDGGPERAALESGAPRGGPREESAGGEDGGPGGSAPKKAGPEHGAPEEREALLWDLAGQEDYRLIHRLFLGQTALALLLINPQNDDPFREAGDWLKALETARNLEDPAAGEKVGRGMPVTEANRIDQGAGADTPRLLVFSQIDVGGLKVSDAKVQEFRDQYGFADWIATSAKTGQNCSDGGNGGAPSRLKQLIANHIPWDTLPWTATPERLLRLKNAVMEMRDEADIRLLRFAELKQRLSQALPGEAPDDDEMRTAVTLLANHGLVRVLPFGDLVLLRPDLISGYSAAIIRAARAHSDEIGCVAERDIFAPDFDFTGIADRLNRPDEELLLRAVARELLDHSLCIAEDTADGRQLVFPSQYRREKPLPWQPAVFVSYRFRGEWQTVWTTLVVRLWYGNEFTHRELWRNAAEFASSRGHLLGLQIDNRQGEGEAVISLFFDPETPDELKVLFIEYLHRHLEKYAVDVTRDRRYVCRCGKAVTDMAAVRGRLAARKSFIYCQACDEKVPLQDLIEQRLQSDPVARRILAMEEHATRQLDNQAREQRLLGHMMAVCNDANQIFRPVQMFDYGIDGEVEFKDDNGEPSGKRIYLQLKSGDSYLRTRKGDGKEVFDVKNARHLAYWQNQPVDVYLVIGQDKEHQEPGAPERGRGEHGKDGRGIVRWMNVSRYLKEREDKDSRQIVFDGEEVTLGAIWRVRDGIWRVRDGMGF
uniref:WD domain-containing protein, G-beta repeat-containing protein n=1 Tax=Candidatus Kentrum sp. DK TaxID=2126562 RepID=A0A450RV12_9GAMM|nr:MAG: WD domain-containing protein, G-beta repeat-containing protein [Candidatus Kentron sp. DK]